MSLDVVNNIEVVETHAYNAIDLPALDAFSKWQNFPISNISHHGKLCCEIAREWLTAMDYSQLNSGSILSGPRWIPYRYSWGPTKWPIHWCEAVSQKSLDCGAQSAIAHQIFQSRGVQSYRVQLVQEFSKDTTRQWSERWTSDDTSIFWIDQDLIYHECCAVAINNGDIKLWDGSAACWVNSEQISGYGAVRALRLFSSDKSTFNWGTNVVNANCWQDIKNR